MITSVRAIFVAAALGPPALAGAEAPAVPAPPEAECPCECPEPAAQLPAGPPPAQAAPPLAASVPAAPPIAAPSAKADAARSHLFLSARLGAFVPRKEFGVGPELGSALDFELGLGTRVARLLTAEVSVGRYRSTASQAEMYGSAWVLGVTTFTATLRALLPRKGRLAIFGLGGVGLYHSKLEVERWDPATGSERKSSRTDAPFGFHLGAGLDFAVAPQVRIGTEVRYVSVGGSYSVPGDTAEFSYGGVRAAAALRYGF